MRIGIMLRHYEQHGGGVKVYTKNIMSRLLSMGSKHHYVLIYQNPKLIGTYSSYPNVEEVTSTIPGTVLWDQLAVPWIAKKKKLDLIFNPKFTVPVFSRAKKIFVLHGSEWFVIPESYPWYDQLYFKMFAPFYCRHADAFITVSETVKKDVVTYTGVKPDKVFPVHNGFDPGVFHVIGDAQRRESIRKKYNLPERFLCWIGQVYPPKNIGRLLQAFAQLRDEIPHQLVLVGEQRWHAQSDFDLIQKLGIQDRVHVLGWVSHEYLPIFYNLAALFVLPSLYEGFGLPLLESMACGCPIVTSNTCSPPEVTDGAAYLVDPLIVDTIAEGIRRVLSDAKLRESMIARGLERAKCFGWDECVSQILSVFDSFRA